MPYLAALLALAPAEESHAQSESDEHRPWAVSLYGAVGTEGGIEQIPGLDAEFTDSYLGVIAVSRELGRWRDLVGFELEGQLGQHFGKQDHIEFNALLVGRWHAFPWNESLRTSIAIGEGVSYATEIPEIERERSPDKTSHLLNYLMIEVEVAPPDDERWSAFARIHHRSGVYGLYNDVSKGSNFVGAGVRFRF